MKAIIKFIPIFVLAGMMISGFDILVSAPFAVMAAIAVAMITDKRSFQSCIDSAVESVQKIIVAMFILLLAYAMANVFMASGVGASVVNIALSLGVNARTVAVVGLLVTAVLSVATGTSWGTFAACAPIFLWLNHIVGGDIVLTAAACAGGACFGDNIGLISDTTIVSSAIQEVEVVDRVRHQGVWSVLCLAIASVVIFIIGAASGLSAETVDAAQVISTLPENVWEVLAVERPVAVDLLKQVEATVPFYMAIPLVLVVGLAIAGFNTFACIGSGIISAYFLGRFAGTVTSAIEYIDLCVAGFADGGSWAIQVMMWVSAFGGIMSSINAFEPLSKLIVKFSNNVRQLMFYNGLFSLFGNAALSDEMAQIVTCGPIIKNIVDENVVANEKDMYTLHLRNSAFSDAMGVFGSQLVPWHCYIVFYLGLATAVFPLHEFTAAQFITHNYLAMIAVFSMLFLTVTGLDRFIPLFKLPSEPDVQLKKNVKQVI